MLHAPYLTCRNGNGTRSEPASRLSRRGFVAGVAGAAGATALGWAPAFQAAAGSAQATLPAPPSLPAGIPLYQQAYQNWAKEVVVDAVWTCAPATPDDVVTIVDRARAQGYKVRPRGAMHNWSPLTIVKGADLSRVLLVDTTRNLRAITVNAAGSPATVTAQAGATMEAILGALQAGQTVSTVHDAGGPPGQAASRSWSSRGRRERRGTARRGWWPVRPEPATNPGQFGQSSSKRSRFMTLSHAATKSRTNFSCASALP